MKVSIHFCENFLYSAETTEEIAGKKQEVVVDLTHLVSVRRQRAELVEMLREMKL